MKKLTTILGVILFASMTLTSYGDSAGGDLIQYDAKNVAELSKRNGSKVFFR